MKENREKKENKKIRRMTIASLTLIVVFGVLMCLYGYDEETKIRNENEVSDAVNVKAKKVVNQ